MRMTSAMLGAAVLLGTVLLPAAAQTAAPASAPSAAERLVRVTGFKVTGRTLLEEGALQAVLAPYLGERTLEELRRAALEVQQRYVDAGYGAVVAYLPSQSIEDGTVTIAVVEGRVSEVVVQGAKRQTQAQIRAALPSLVEGQTPRVRRIDSELQIANENPGRRVSVLLGPGEQPGEVKATVEVQEDARMRWNLSLDNTGNERTGRYRAGVGWQNFDLTGHDDVLSVQLATSPTAVDSVLVASAGYRVPLVRWLSALDVFAAYSDVDGGVTPSIAGPVSFSGQGHVAGMRWTYFLPRMGGFDQRVIGGIDARTYLNQCAVGGLPPGACGPAGASVSVQPLSIEYAAQRGGANAAGVNVAFVGNLALGGSHGDAADFAAVRAGAPKRYSLMRLGGHYRMPVFDEWSLRGHAAAQYAFNPLVPGEQFGAGGVATVRGYEEREVTGDRGFTATVELTGPPIELQFGERAADLRLVAFADVAQVTNHDAAACTGTRTRCSLASFGAGVRFGAGAVHSEFLVAQALKDGASTDQGDVRAHFSISASF